MAPHLPFLLALLIYSVFPIAAQNTTMSSEIITAIPTSTGLSIASTSSDSTPASTSSFTTSPDIITTITTSGTSSSDTTASPSTLTSTIPPPLPTLSPGNLQYHLLGCYNELAANASSRAVGLTGSYISPTLATPDNLTVSLCLEDCSEALAPNGAGSYAYAAVENSRECYCGLTLSNDSTPRDPNYCSSPCSGDATVSCGGFGYLTLYELLSAINTTNTASQIPSTTAPLPSPTQAPSPSQTNKINTTGLWIGISLGLFFLAILVFSLAWWENHLHLTRRRSELSSEANRGFLGGYKLRQQALRPQRSRDTFEDGRRFGVIGNGAYVAPLEVQTEEAGKRYRDTFEAWKRGVVPVSPEDVRAPVMIGDSLGERARGVDLRVEDDVGALRDLGFSYVGMEGVSELPGSDMEVREVPVHEGLEASELESPTRGSFDGSTISILDAEATGTYRIVTTRS